MLDRPYPGLQRRDDSRLAMAVRGDHPLGHSGDLHDRAQFRIRELLVDGMVDFRQRLRNIGEGQTEIIQAALRWANLVVLW